MCKENPENVFFLETRGRWYFKKSIIVNVPGAADGQRREAG